MYFGGIVMTDKTYSLLKQRRKELDLTMADVAKAVGVSEATVSRWESGNIANMRRDKIALIADVLKINPAILIFDEKYADDENSKLVENLKNDIIPIKTKKIPLIGEIACGKPIVANHEYEVYVDATTDINADFALKAKGDSMINARIHDGDIVFIRQQPDVENGEIAAVIIDDEATLKRVYKNDNSITLVAENPKYPPLVYTSQDCVNINIIGKAIAFQSDVT